MTPALTAPILVLVVYILIAASGGLDLLSLGSEESVYLSTIAVRLMDFTVPGIFYVKLKESGYTLRLGFSPIGIGKIGFCLTVLGALISFSLLIRMFTGHMEASLPVIMPGLEEAAASVGDANFFYILVSFAIVPAVCEEFIFRAILLTEYSEYGCPTAVITSAALYGMLAFSPADFPLLFVMGILLGMAFYTTRSVTAPLLIHFGYSAWVLFLDEKVMSLLNQPTNAIFLRFFVCLIFLGFMITLLGTSESIYYIYGTQSLATPSYYKENRKKFTGLFSVITSPAFLVCVLIFFIISMIGI